MMKRVMSLFLASPVMVLVACSGGNNDGFGRELPVTAPLNDTGISLCGDYAYAPGSSIHNNNVNCMTAGASQTTDGSDVNGDIVPAGQDALYGRDVTDYDDSDGSKGFSFTKLGANGLALTIQNKSWDADGPGTGNEINGMRWSCVRDEVTSLVWEVKNNDGFLHDKDWIYTWFDDNSATNGGNEGTPDVIGIGSTAGNCYSQNNCDTKKYVQDVNGSNFCGGNTWRLPSRDELKTLRHLGIASPAIEQNYFPNTPAANFWTATPHADVSSDAWFVDFFDGSEQPVSKSQAYAVRLVRDAN